MFYISIVDEKLIECIICLNNILVLWLGEVFYVYNFFNFDIEYK